MTHVVAFSGSLRRPSRTRTLVELAVQSATRARLDIETDVYDLVDGGPGLAALSRDELPREALRLVEAIEKADALIVASPVYKGSYTGLFKHVIDFVDPTALVNKPVLIAATGGGLRHALVVEHQLRPLFAFFGAATVPTAIYASDQEIVDGAIVEPGLRDRLSLAVTQFVTLLPQTSKANELSSVPA